MRMPYLVVHDSVDKNGDAVFCENLQWRERQNISFCHHHHHHSSPSYHFVITIISFCHHVHHLYSPSSTSPSYHFVITIIITDHHHHHHHHHHSFRQGCKLSSPTLSSYSSSSATTLKHDCHHHTFIKITLMVLIII